MRVPRRLSGVRNSVQTAPLDEAEPSDKVPSLAGRARIWTSVVATGTVRRGGASMPGREPGNRFWAAPPPADSWPPISPPPHLERVPKTGLAPQMHPRLMWGTVGGMGMRWKAFASADFMNATPDLLMGIEDAAKVLHVVATKMEMPEWVGVGRPGGGAPWRTAIMRDVHFRPKGISPEHGRPGLGVERPC